MPVPVIGSMGITILWREGIFLVGRRVLTAMPGRETRPGIGSVE
jgi:hypothetical protein